MDALERASSYLSRRPHTEKEVTDYLIRKEYSPEETAAAVASLKEYGYIDDLAYAKLYFEYGYEKGRGRDRIIRELAGKGVSRESIDQAYEELEEKPDEEALAMQIAAQTVREAGSDLASMTYEEKQKLQARIARKLASRGFNGSLCYRAARETVK